MQKRFNPLLILLLIVLGCIVSANNLGTEPIVTGAFWQIHGGFLGKGVNYWEELMKNDTPSVFSD